MSFQQGLSGLNVTSKSLEVIGNNVANANTTGFKSSRAEFADVYATGALDFRSTMVGNGVRPASIAQQFGQDDQHDCAEDDARQAAHAADDQHHAAKADHRRGRKAFKKAQRHGATLPNRAQALEEFRTRNMDSPLALDRLDKDRDRIFIHGGTNGIEITFTP